MPFQTLRFAWASSRFIYPERSVRSLVHRISFCTQALRHAALLQPFMASDRPASLTLDLNGKPEMVGALIWPYISALWPAETRLKAILDHYRFIDQQCAALSFPVSGSLDVLNLDAEFPGLRVVLDKPSWFMREGQMTLNLFIAEKRIFSTAFSFGTYAGDTATYVGGIQGVRGDDSLDSYRDLTKALHGMRPRDFLLEMLRSLCRAVHVKHLLAVSDAGRHHRSSYFGKIKAESLHLEYDDIWRERGGEPNSEDFFLLSSESNQRDIDEIPSKKRAMYRKRYELLAAAQAHITQLLNPAP